MPESNSESSAPVEKKAFNLQVRKLWEGVKEFFPLVVLGVLFLLVVVSFLLSWV